MKTVRVTIKNYRGFSDQVPVRIEIGEGLTALLGANNAGKSSLKLFFYEMRELFEVLLRGPDAHACAIRFSGMPFLDALGWFGALRI
jgi:AAA15 family ATPase/GTPase